MNNDGEHSSKQESMNASMPLAFAILIFAQSIFNCGVGFAQNGTVPPGVAGYTVSMQNSWVTPNQGFIPIRVTIDTNPPLAAVEDEKFTISIRQRSYNASGSLVKATVIIPAGSKSGTAELYYPSGASSNVYENKVLIEAGEFDGRYDRNDLLQADFRFQVSYGIQPTLMMISSEFQKPAKRSWVTFKNTVTKLGATQNSFTSRKPLPEFEELESLFGNQRLGMVANPVATTKRVPSVVMDQSPSISGIHSSHLPEQWIGLSSIEQIVISASDYRSICANQERDRANIERWVAVGGVLIVIDSGIGFPETDKLLPMLLGPERSVLADRIEDQWKIPSLAVRDLDKLLTNLSRGSNYYYANQGQSYSPAEVSAIRARKGLLTSVAKIPSKAKFAATTYLNGQIVAVADDMSKWKAADWRLLHNTLALNGKSIRQRIGSMTGKQRIESFRIPGVGDPPVMMFQVLISLFILLAGPVMLLVLKRTQQMQYLFIAVPCLSAAVCFGLFSYAILVDGYKKWGRAQTVTTIDHRTNMVVTHARATYYSGGRPEPYVSTLDTLALTGVSESADTVVMEFGSESYQVTGGEIRPRSPHEMVTIRSHSTPIRLELIESDDDKSSVQPQVPSIKNSLGSEVLAVAFRTSDGIFVIENLAVGETAEARKVDLRNARTTLSTLIRKQSYTSDNSGGGRWVDDPDDAWGDEMEVVNNLRSSDRGFLTSDNSYVAILGEFSLAAEQIEDVEYKLQLHVVRGQW